ncbi:lipoprotein [Marinobacteraceae bacterium S3BR75-40.1]
MPRLLPALLALLLLLSACGQKGPLYRPAPPPAADTQSQQPADEPADKRDS